MYIHKFKAGGNMLYLINDKPGRPAGMNTALGTPEWLGAAGSGKAGNIPEHLSEIEFRRDVKEEEPKEVVEETTTEVNKTDKTARTVPGHLRVIARYLELRS